MTTIAVIGHGEAGALNARGLRAMGYTVTGYDPFTVLGEDGIKQHHELADTVAEAAMVISLVGSLAAQIVAQKVLRSLRAEAILADFNTGSPALGKSPASALDMWPWFAFLTGDDTTAATAARQGGAV